MNENIENIRNSLLQVSNSFVNSFDEPLVTHRKGLSGNLVLLVKRVIRKCTRFLLKPYAERSHVFQEKIYETLGLMIAYLDEMDKQNHFQFTDISGEVKPDLTEPEQNHCNRILSNGIIDVAEAYLLDKKFLWAINSTDPTDSISNIARQGIVPIDHQLLGLFPAAGTFLDIGANIGAFTLSFAVNGWNGYAFEASARNVYALKNSIMLNNFDVEVIETAVYDKIGEIYFVQDGPWGFVQNKVFENQEYEKINCISLDDWINSHETLTKIDLIKIDVEGCEVAALRGMRRLLDQFDYPPIFIEMNAYALCLQGETQHSLLSLTRSMGYKTFELRNNTLYTVDENRIPKTFCTDFLLTKNPLPTLNYSVVDGYVMSEKETIDQIIGQLSNRSSWNELSRYGREKSAEDYGAYICYALKDYPTYSNHPEIKAQLAEIASEKGNNSFVKKAIGWFVEKQILENHKHDFGVNNSAAPPISFIIGTQAGFSRVGLLGARITARRCILSQRMGI